MKCFAATAALCCAGTCAATSVVIPVDQTQSSISVQLCISGSCDTDASPVVGSYTLDLDAPASPTQVSVLDYTNTLTETIDLSISFGFLGAFNATGSGIAVNYAAPGIPTGPAPITAGAYSLANVPTLAQGSVAYTATGIVCSLLSSQVPPVPCASAINLADQGVQNGTLQGSISVSNGIISFVATLNSTAPLDPANPATGTITISGTIRGSAPVPPPPECPGDANGDLVVNAADLSVLLANFGFPATGPGSGDFNADGQCNSADLSVLLSAFGSSC
jgi:hypothetical protein